MVYAENKPGLLNNSYLTGEKSDRWETPVNKPLPSINLLSWHRGGATVPNKGIEGKLEGLKYNSCTTFYYPEYLLPRTYLEPCVEISDVQTSDSTNTKNSEGTKSSEGGNSRLLYLHTGLSLSASHPVTMILPVLFREAFLVLNLARRTGTKCNKIDSFDKRANCLQ